MTDNEELESFGASVARGLDHAIRCICGEERGFVLLICTEPPGPSGNATVFSNIDPESIGRLLAQASSTIEVASRNIGPTQH